MIRIDWTEYDSPREGTGQPEGPPETAAQPNCFICPAVECRMDGQGRCPFLHKPRVYKKKKHRPVDPAKKRAYNLRYKEALKK